VPTNPQIISTSPEKWPELSADVIGTAVKSFFKTKGKCSLMLTGGNTARGLYQYWAVSKPWDHREVRYFLGDERCVPPYHEDSNYGMVRQTLFPTGIPKGCVVKKMKGDLFDRELAAKYYE